MSAARKNVCLFLLIVLGFTLGCSEFIVIGIEPDIAASYQISLARAGELMSSFSVAYALCTPVLALTTGRFKRYHLLIAYAVLFCVGNAIAVFATSFPVLFASRVVMGAVSGALLAVGITFIPEFVVQRRVPFMISVVYAAFSVAMVLSTSLGKLAAEYLSWHVALEATLALAVLVSAVLVVLLPRTGSTDEPATVREQLPMLKDARILSGMLIFVFGVGSVYVFYAYVTPYLEDVFGLSAVGASAVLMGYGCVCFVSNLLSGWCEARFGLPALVFTFVVQALLLLGLFAVGSSAGAGIAVVLGIALSMYILSTPCVSLFINTARREYPKALTLAASIEPMSFNIGIAFGTAVGGCVVGGIGMGYVGLVGAVFSLVACGLTLLTMRLARRGQA